jgi:hypothetical protein
VVVVEEGADATAGGSRGSTRDGCEGHVRLECGWVGRRRVGWQHVLCACVVSV